MPSQHAWYAHEMDTSANYTEVSGMFSKAAMAILRAMEQAR